MGYSGVAHKVNKRERFGATGHDLFQNAEVRLYSNMMLSRIELQAAIRLSSIFLLEMIILKS